MSDYFPLEVIIEILQKLPVKSLVRFMCVCKAWKSIITDDSFIISNDQHLQTNPANSSLFFHLQPYAISSEIKAKYDFYSLYSDDDATHTLPVFQLPPSIYPSNVYGMWKAVGTCNGLVCFADYSLYSNSGQAVIWNPSIHKYLILPQPSLFFKSLRPDNADFYGFGFDSPNHDFKVVRFVSSSDPETSCQVEIYSLAAHSWRTITVAPLPFRIALCSNKFVNGKLYWLAYRIINGMKHYYILTFDIVEEKFGELMLPQCLPPPAALSVLTGGNLLALKQSYCGVCSYECCTIWVMKEYDGVESWAKLFHFDSTTYGVISRVLALRNNEEVIIQSLDHEITILDPIKGLVKKIGHKFVGKISFLGDHVESLFLINEKRAEAYLPDTYLSL